MNNMLNVLKENNHQPRIVYAAKISFKNTGKIRQKDKYILHGITYKWNLNLKLELIETVKMWLPETGGWEKQGKGGKGYKLSVLK